MDSDDFFYLSTLFDVQNESTTIPSQPSNYVFFDPAASEMIPEVSYRKVIAHATEGRPDSSVWDGDSEYLALVLRFGHTVATQPIIENAEEGSEKEIASNSKKSFISWPPVVSETFSSFLLRKWAGKRYSWAIPNQHALQELASLGKILEVYGGGGYWAHLLELPPFNVDIVCTDANPPPSALNEYSIYQWCPVQKMTALEAVRHYSHEKDRALFLSWPPFDDSVLECVKIYQGTKLAYIGEWDGVFMGEVWANLQNLGWQHPKIIEIPRWYLKEDYLFIFDRL